MKPEVSIILPTKEEEGAFYVIRDLKRMFGSRAELIVVDKSSEEYRNKIKKTGVTLVRQKSKGVENGLLEGFERAHADILATVDADGTHELSGIEAGVKLIKQKKAGLVLGNRMANPDPGSMSPYLWFGNWGLSWMYNIFYKQNIHDVLTGMQIMGREPYEKVKNLRPFDIQIAFLQTEIARMGYKVIEVPIKYHERTLGVSKLAKSKLMYGFHTGDHIIERSNYYAAFMTFGILGIVTIVLGVLYGISLGFSIRPLLAVLMGIFFLLFGINVKSQPKD
jgi:glycosyltransferase involved in cell wall biosynthesis